jgi:ABC-type uncharacterized transport system
MTVPQTNPSKAPTDWVAELTPYRLQIGIGLHVLAGVFLIAPVAIRFMAPNTSALFYVWLLVMAVVSELTALWCHLAQGSAKLKDEDQLRIALLTFLGQTGFGLVVLGCLLPMLESYRKVLTGDLNEYRKNPWILISFGAAIFGGLILMFLGVQLARAYERSQALMRRLLYGYNTVLGVLLLSSILTLANVLTHVTLWPFNFFSHSFDWTAKGIHTLAPSSIAFLQDLKQPVKIYVILTPTDNSPSPDVESLLDNCRSYNPNITWTMLSPNLQHTEVKQLQEKYKIPEPEGLLVLYGPASDDLSDFIRRDEIAGRGARFNGEYALFKSLGSLAGHKAKAKILFLQGDGELDVDGSDVQKHDAGINDVFTKFNEGNYEFKKFQFGKDPLTDLKTADVVVIAGPSRFSDKAVEGLRAYLKEQRGSFRLTDRTLAALKDDKAPEGVLNDLKKLKDKEVATEEEFTAELAKILKTSDFDAYKKTLTANAKEGFGKGKLLVMMDVYTDGQGHMKRSGLEPLLEEYGVHVNDDLVLCAAKNQDPQSVIGVINPRSSNAMARAFYQASTTKMPQFQFWRARSLEPKPGPGAQYSVEPLIFAPPQLGNWSARQLDSDPEALAADVRKEGDIPPQPPILAVAVTEQSEQLPPGHPQMPQPRTPGQPVMLVYGDASWIANDLQNIEDNAALFSSSLTWLRGKPDLGRKPSDYAKTPDKYELKVTESEWLTLVLLPALLLVVGITVLGGGVWVVRRR